MSIKDIKNMNMKSRIIDYLYVLPAVFFMLALIGYPIIYNFIISIQDVTALTLSNGIREFIGFENYTAIFQYKLFWESFKNTFIYTIGCLSIQFSIGLLLALFFNQDFKFSNYTRGLIVISWMLPVTVTALIFKFMLGEGNGIINQVLMLLNIINRPIGWLINKETAMLGVIIANSWVGIPFNMLLLANGLGNIPNEVYESASVDGANRIQKFLHITIPLLKPTIMSVLILGFVLTFKVFDLIYVMTAGGPVDATEVLSTYSYQQSFRFFDFGKGAATANILFASLFTVGLLYLKFVSEEEAV